MSAILQLGTRPKTHFWLEKTYLAGNKFSIKQCKWNQTKVLLLFLLSSCMLSFVTSFGNQITLGHYYSSCWGKHSNFSHKQLLHPQVSCFNQGSKVTWLCACDVCFREQFSVFAVQIAHTSAQRGLINWSSNRLALARCSDLAERAPRCCWCKF